MANGNGANITLTAIVVAIALTFGGFTVYKVYVKDPECYAQKSEVKELKDDIKSELRAVNHKLDMILMRKSEP